MLIAQISDLHVAPEDSFMRRFVDSNLLLERAITYLNTMTPRPDVVVATGDLTDHGTAEEYVMLGEILAALEVPLFLVPGNHDEPEVMRQVMGTPAYVDGLTFCFVHHPPFETGIWWMDCIGLTGARDLETIVRRHPQVRQIVAGHVHRPVSTVWGSTLLTTAPSTCHQTAVALHEDCPPRITTEPPMLALHQWTGDGFVSHATVFDRDGADLDIAELVSDWPSAKASILARGPMHKGSSPVG